MNILLAGHIAVARGSRISKVGQQRLQRFKRRQVGSGLSEDHRGADNRIEHPGRHHGHDPGRRLDGHVLDAAANLAVEPTERASMQGVPAVVDRGGRTDMGRMIPNG